MPLYEYRCKVCDERFEVRRSMADADAPTACASGHTDTARLLAAFAATGRATAGPSAAPPAAPCGAGCACAHQ